MNIILPPHSQPGMVDSTPSGSDWPQMGQSGAFSDRPRAKCTESDLKKSRICPIYDQSGAKPTIPVLNQYNNIR